MSIENCDLCDKPAVKHVEAYGKKYKFCKTHNRIWRMSSGKAQDNEIASIVAHAIRSNTLQVTSKNHD